MRGLYESNQITNREYASVEFLSASGCTGTSDTDDAPEQPDSPEPIPEGPEAEEEVEKGTGGNALASEPETVNSETTGQIRPNC